MKKCILLFVLFLAACGKVDVPPPIVTNPCIPPPDLMKIEAPLDPLPEGPMSEKMALEYWVHDISRLNNVIIDKNALVDHIKKYCEKQ